jgi:hypothetical protein
LRKNKTKKDALASFFTLKSALKKELAFLQALLFLDFSRQALSLGITALFV